MCIKVTIEGSREFFEDRSAPKSSPMLRSHTFNSLRERSSLRLTGGVYPNTFAKSTRGQEA
jgi:hypothetical protein